MGDEHDHGHVPQRQALWRNAITNWSQPMPFHVKVRKLVRNLWIRVATGSDCCGHAGEPGC